MEGDSIVTLKIPDRVDSLIHYDSKADILYISFGELRPAEDLDIGDGTILRIDPKTEGVIGLTILDFSKRVEG